MKKEEARGKKIVVIGLGVSGIACARLFSHLGAQVTANDADESTSLLLVADALREEGVVVQLGTPDPESFRQADFIILSPGVSPKTPLYQTLQRDYPDKMVSEIEAASWFVPCPIVAITGTNGKSSTTKLIEGLFLSRGRHAIGCGNLGRPLSDALSDLTEDSICVVEVSSFQLHTIRSFHPCVAAVLNITPDHLNWHADMEEYSQAKFRIFENQVAGDLAIINESCRDYFVNKAGVSAELSWFDEETSDHPNWEVVRRVGHFFAMEAAEVETFLKQAPPLEHRMELSQSTDGRNWINDSKSTNPASLEWALKRMEPFSILIAGGRNKGNHFDHLLPLLKEKAKTVILYGEAATEMARDWESLATIQVGALEEAVKKAASISLSGETILLSPGCASFDQFMNFEHRGREFKRLVADETLAKKTSFAREVEL